MNELLGLLLEVTGIQRTLIGGAGGNRVTLVIERYRPPQPPARLAAIACQQPAVGLRRILITPCLGRQCAQQCLLVAVSSDERRVGKEWVSTCRSRGSRLTS